jgi:SAM-dependent methyltransferase
MEDVLYDQHAALEHQHWWFQGRRQIVADVLRGRLGSSDAAARSILDVGSGTGEMLDMLCEFGAVRGIDMSPRAVAYCHERFGTTIDVRVGRLPDDLAPADVITAFDVIEHLADDEEALRRIRAVLPPDGVFVCTVPAFQFLWSAHDELNHHQRRYGRRELRRRLQSAGFHIERLTYFNTMLFPAAAGVRLLRRRTSDARTQEMSLPPRWANRFLLQLFKSESRIVRTLSLPFGLSLLAVCTPSDR